MRSPIETALIAALREHAARDNSGLTIVDYSPDVDHYGEGDEEWSLYSNVPIGSYRVDLVLDTGYAPLAIECDGHEYHNITKQQAAYDRSRDRWLLAQGVPTIRFTGSEIVHGPERCVADLLAVTATLTRQGFALAQAGCTFNGVNFRGGPKDSG